MAFFTVEKIKLDPINKYCVQYNMSKIIPKYTVVFFAYFSCRASHLKLIK